jgi:outer membrane protein assembly factor BamB
MTTGTDTSEVDVELSRMLDNLRYLCMGPDGLIIEKYEHYKEQILSVYSSERLDDDDEQDDEESMTPVNQPSLPIVSSGPMNSAWPMISHDNHHTGLSPYKTNNISIEKWRIYFTDWFEEHPVIDNDGIIYCGGSYNAQKWYLFAIYPNGTIKWKYKTGGLIWRNAPAIDEDGTVYIGTWDCKIYAFNPDGTLKWKSKGTSGSISVSPAIAEDGTIYFGTLWGMGSGGHIYAMYPNGTIKWNYKTGYAVNSDPAIGDDGTIYIGSCDNFLYAMNPDGTLKWRFKTGDWVNAHPAIGDDGTIYISSYDNTLYALWPTNGTLKWKVGNAGDEGGPAIGADGIIYVPDEKLTAVYPNGTVKWRKDLGPTGDWSAPAISNDDIIYVGAGTFIFAVDLDGNILWKKKLTKRWVESSPCIAKDGTVYIGSAQQVGGCLHAFGTQESNEPPTIPSITGPSEGKADREYDFTFKSTDPDRNPVSFYIEWGDGTTTGWTMEYYSGEKAEYSHSWSEKGNYTIRAKAKDTFGLESDWAQFEIGIIKKSKSTNNILFWRLIGQFPMLQKLLFFIS